MIGHHGLVALLELDLGGLVSLHPELGDHLGQGHLHLGHREPLPCGRNMKTSLSEKAFKLIPMQARGPAPNGSHE